MAGIRLQEAGKAIVYQSVPWSKHLTSLKTESFPKGAVPPHLVKYLFKAGGLPAECAKKTEGLKGSTRVTAMNACVSARKKLGKVM
jgi:hypothetical protein